jgi:hypothetical protein
MITRVEFFLVVGIDLVCFTWIIFHSTNLVSVPVVLSCDTLNCLTIEDHQNLHRHYSRLVCFHLLDRPLGRMTISKYTFVK